MAFQVRKNQVQILKDNLDDIAPDMVEYIVAYGYGDIYSRKNLDMKMRQIATIVALTARDWLNLNWISISKQDLMLGLRKKRLLKP